MRRPAAAWMVAVLLFAAASCADSKFLADGVDARRLGELRDDPAVVFLKSAGASCQEQIAHYKPASGEPFDFAAVELNQVDCQGPRETALHVLDVAAAGGWTPGWSLFSFELRKHIGDAWATMTVSNTGPQLFVHLALPPHTDKGYPPRAADSEKGRACLASARSGQPPTQECPLKL